MATLTSPRPLSADDDRHSFDCGRESLNLWFQRHALRNQESSVSRTNVICDAATGAMAGYVSLSAAHIERAHLPTSAQRNRPDPIPALLLGQLAVDKRYQGRGCAASLMLFALKTAVRFAQEVGCFCVLTHPLDDEARSFYARFGFETLPFGPQRAMLVRMAELEHNGF